MLPESIYNKKNPFHAPVTAWRKLTKEGGAKDSFHNEIDLTGSGLTYVAGDALGVYPCNDEALVDALIAAMALDPAEIVPLPKDGEATLREALINNYDITNLKKPLLVKWNKVAASEKLSNLLADKEALSNYMWGRDLLDVASDPEMKASFANAVSFVAILTKLSPRLYSIASSPDTVVGQVSLCVEAVRYHVDGRQRGGICSTYMADRLPVGAKARVFVHSNKNFRLPENGATPIIMVGPGTGIAPYRSFWEQRVIDQATGPMWLFFGNPHAATDGCYEDEIDALVQAGKLKYSVAWSRDQEQKIYVQHLMEQEGEELWKWLEAGAAFYVCGDAQRMARDVEKALLALIAQHGQRSPEEATAYLAAMKAQQRYQRDVY